MKYPFIIISVFLLSSFFSCKEDFDDYSTDSSHILSFSTDTVSFDTLLSTLGSATREFMIYNKNNKAIKISSIQLESGGKSGFRININAKKGDLIQDIEIGANDSIFGFIEATLPESGENTPVLINDHIIFTTNSVQQKIALEAMVQDVYVWKSKVIDSQITLPNEKPYLIYDSLIIKNEAEMIIPEGTTFYLNGKARIIVYGNIKAIATKDKPIIFRGARTDYLLKIPYDRVPNQWEGIFFKSSSFENEMEYVNIRNSNYGLYFDKSDPEKSKLKIKNSVLTNSAANLITAYNCNIEAENCEFSNSGKALVYLNGGKYNFTQCTMANYMTWGSVNPTGKTLVLSNVTIDSKKNKISLPLLEANFNNSIIYGSKNTESRISFPDTTSGKGIPFNYYFRNCLVIADSAKLNQSQISNCIYNKDPKFLDSNNTDTLYIYNFHLDSISPARNTADPDIAKKLPYDMDGISRLQDKGPDMGAYEYVPAKTK